jgi:hypothetical protein
MRYFVAFWQLAPHAFMLSSTMRNTITFLLLIHSLSLYGQTHHPWELGMGIGAAAYLGETNDLQLGTPAKGFHPEINLQARKNLNNSLALRAQVLFTRISGNDRHFRTPAWRQERGLLVNSSLLNISLTGEFYPTGIYTHKKGKSRKQHTKRRVFTPFIAAGLGVDFTNPKVYWNDQPSNDYLDPLLVSIDKGRSNKPDISVPVGLGARFSLSKRLTLGIEGFIVPTLGDYLDGVSVAGNPDDNDWYVFAGLSGCYAFGESNRKNKKPETEKPETASKPAEPDRDNDGIPDIYDQCPDGAGTLQLFGCPDSDRDGVADRDDHCPDVPGLASLKGCTDMDEDGIADKDDSCPDQKGTLEYRGCPPVDRDKDGVADAEDLCPDMRGQLRYKGCPDSDADGIPDNKDACPGIAGPERLKGCPDSDADGISDKEDECPTLAGIPEKNGCPEALPPAPGVPFKAVYFGSTLEGWYNTSIVTLDEVVTILQADPMLEARMEGHTDNTGQEPANDLLAEKRAKRCRDYLITKGIDPKRLSYLGHGSQKPFVPNDTRENRQLNRRVEIHFLRSGKAVK